MRSLKSVKYILDRKQTVTKQSTAENILDRKQTVGCCILHYAYFCGQKSNRSQVNDYTYNTRILNPLGK